MYPFAFNTTAGIRFRSGLIHDAARECGRLLGSHILFVTDPGIMKLGLAEPAIRSFESAGIVVSVFQDVEADPSLETLNNGVETALEVKATGVVGFGGGSSMDVAKLVALLAGSKENLDEAWGVANAKGPRLPLVLVPTTAGTGSEVTPVSIITVGADEKRGVSSPIILPDLALLDPDLTTGLPAHITAATGIDAMVHAIEAYASRSPNNNPMSKMLAVEALKLLGSNIETAVFQGHEQKSRSGMLLGSMLAGMAFANSPVAAVHALAYPIGGIFHIPHGLSNALVLPHVLKFNAPEAASEYAELAPHIFPELDKSEGSQAICAEFIDRLSQLSAKLGLETKLREVGIGEEHLERMAADAMKQTRLLVNNPRDVTQDDALAIYRAAW